MPTTSAWCGVPTRTAVTVNYEISSADSARLVVSTAADLSVSPIYSAPATPDASGAVRLTATGLTTGTVYHFGVETTAAGVPTLETTHRGRFTTDSGAARSFTFTAGGCQHPTHDTISWPQMSAHGSEVMLVLGDFGYPDITTNDPAAFRTHWTSTLGRPGINEFVAQVPTASVWDDHDYAGDAADRTSAARPAAGLVLRERSPMAPAMPATDNVGCYHTFARGRVRFIMLDTRAYRDPTGTVDDVNKTMLGAEQKQWLKDTLDSSPEPVVVLVSPLSWAVEDKVGAALEHWGGYQTEQKELVDFFIARQHYHRIMVLCGDVHALAMDDGGESSVGALPVFQVSSLGGTSSDKQLAFYPHSLYPAAGTNAAVNLYGKFDVVDDGGAMISVRFGGWDANLNAGAGGEVMTYTWKFGADGKGWPQRTPFFHLDAADITGLADGDPIPTTAGAVPDRQGNLALSVDGADATKAPKWLATAVGGAPALSFDGGDRLVNTNPVGLSAGVAMQRTFVALVDDAVGTASSRTLVFFPIANTSFPFRARNSLSVSNNVLQVNGRTSDTEGNDTLGDTAALTLSTPHVAFSERDLSLNDAFVSLDNNSGSFNGNFNTAAAAGWPVGEQFLAVGGSDVPQWVGKIAAVVIVNGDRATMPPIDVAYWQQQMSFRTGRVVPIPLAASVEPTNPELPVSVWIGGQKYAGTVRYIGA